MFDGNGKAPTDVVDALLREINAAQASIPGMGRATTGFDTLKTGLTRLQFKGWSPSLHAVGIQVKVDERTADDLIRTTEAVRRVVAIQRSRAERSRRRGRRTPYAVNNRPHLAHLHVDRALAILTELSQYSLKATLRSRLEDMHRFTSYDGGANHITDKTAVHEMDHEGGTISMTMTEIVVRDGVVFDGSSLVVEHDRLPATVISALVGRPLGDLVEIHPVIDGRIIQAAHNMPPTALGSRPRHCVHVALPFEPTPIV
jgi:hypothetical protein